MSAADLMELSQIALGNMIGAFTIFMSLVSGYLVDALIVLGCLKFMWDVRRSDAPA